MARPALAILVPLAFAAGCAAPGPYPSLAPRPAETAYRDDEEERVPVAPPDDPALAAELAGLVAAAEAGEAGFRSALPRAEAAVAAAGGAGSDGWIEAQQFVSRLETERARTVSALADLDALAVARKSAGTLGTGDRERLAAATARIQGLADAQSERLDRLKARLSGP